MKFNFTERPERRKFNYKPRFYKPEGNTSKLSETHDTEEFAQRLHENWESRRKRRTERSKFPLKTVIWLAFIVIVLAYLFVKFFE
ncbi:MAG: hypothetical protein RR356_01470 [Bacteroidales bacterium]